MLDDLDKIPWHRLRCSRGIAADVPAMLRELRTAGPERDSKYSPLSELFCTIWHQETVYEATSYAVPFLLELVADPNTPDRAGILNLLAAIATGSGYWEVHDPLVASLPLKKKRRGIEAKKASERVWVANARKAVEAGFDVLIGITKDRSDLRLAAAHVLAQFPDHVDSVGPLLRDLFKNEGSTLYRAGLLLLLGQVEDRSEESGSMLTDAVNCADERQRVAAAISIRRLKLSPLPAGAQEAIAYAIDSDLDELFQGLPWDAGSDLWRR